MPEPRVTTAAPSECKTSEVFSKLKPSDLSWIQTGGGATESQTWYITFSEESGGGFALLQTAYATLGLSPSVQLQVRYTSKDGQKTGKAGSVSGSSMVLSSDKCSYKIDQRNSAQQKEDGSYDVKVGIDDQIKIEFSFKRVSEICQFKEGKALLNGVGYVFHRFIPYGNVSGTLSLPGAPNKPFTGSATLIHGLQSAKPHQIASKWDFFLSHIPSQNQTVIFCQFITPSSLGSVPVTLGIYVNDGSIKLMTTNCNVVYSTDTQEENGYKIPSKKSYLIQGTDTEGQPLEIKVEVKAEKLFEKVDILGDLPFLIRKVLQAFIAKPFAYMWFDEASVQAGSHGELKARSYHEITYINVEK